MLLEPDLLKTSIDYGNQVDIHTICMYDLHNTFVSCKLAKDAASYQFPRTNILSHERFLEELKLNRF
jgi:hypothetical protein